MRSTRTAALVLTAVLAPAAAPAIAQVPSTFSYQGMLTDPAGTAVADGLYALEFRLYDVGAGGTALYTESHPAVPVRDGTFTVVIGSVTPVTLPFDRPYWLGIQVGAGTELAPRVPLTASPYGLALRMPFSGVTSSAAAAIHVRNDGAGRALVAEGFVDVGSPSKTGQLSVFREGPAPLPMINLYSGPTGGRYLATRTTSPYFHTVNEEDTSGPGGGYFQVMRGDGAGGLVVDGNSLAGQPMVMVDGALRDVVFDMATPGDGAVVLPLSAVSRTEILDEPGVASAFAEGFTALPATLSPLVSRTITVPQSGYVLAIGTMQLGVPHAEGSVDYFFVGVSNDPGSLAPHLSLAYTVPSSLPTGLHLVPGTVHGLFPVNSGANTFYVLGMQAAGNSTVGDLQLSLLYFPTAYGTVSAPEPQAASAPAPLDGLAVATRAPLAPHELARERSEAAAVELARTRSEVEVLRAQLERIRERLAAAGQGVIGDE